VESSRAEYFRTCAPFPKAGGWKDFQTQQLKKNRARIVRLRLSVKPRFPSFNPPSYNGTDDGFLQPA
jgi:hypothetical protein